MRRYIPCLAPLSPVQALRICIFGLDTQISRLAINYTEGGRSLPFWTDRVVWDSTVGSYGDGMMTFLGHQWY